MRMESLEISMSISSEAFTLWIPLYSSYMGKKAHQHTIYPLHIHTHMTYKTTTRAHSTHFEIHTNNHFSLWNRIDKHDTRSSVQCQVKQYDIGYWWYVVVVVNIYYIFHYEIIYIHKKRIQTICSIHFETICTNVHIRTVTQVFENFDNIAESGGSCNLEAQHRKKKREMDGVEGFLFFSTIK